MTDFKVQRNIQEPALGSFVFALFCFLNFVHWSNKLISFETASGKTFFWMFEP